MMVYYYYMNNIAYYYNIFHFLNSLNKNKNIYFKYGYYLIIKLIFRLSSMTFNFTQYNQYKNKFCTFFFFIPK